MQRFRRSNKALFDAHMESVRISVWYFPIDEFAGAATTAAVVGVGGVLVLRGSVSLGTVAAFVLLLANLFEPVQQLSQLFNTVQASGASLKKLCALLDIEPEVAEHPGAVDLPPVGDIEVSDISFAYGPDLAAVLQHVSMTITNGERIALVGPTGAGKSILAKLVARLYDPTAGVITYGGVDLRNATSSSLRRGTVVVPQEWFLFDGTVRENVRIARVEATHAEGRAGAARGGRAPTVRRPARRPRHEGARARCSAVGGGASARLTRSCGARRSGRARARRGDVSSRIA